MRRDSFIVFFIVTFLVSPVFSIPFEEIPRQYMISQEYSVEGEAQPTYSGKYNEVNNSFIRGTCLGPEKSAYTISTEYTSFNGTPKHILYIIKWNYQAQVLWSKEWNVSGDARPNAIISNKDGVYIAGAYVEGGKYNIFLICYSHSGEEKWVKTWSEGERNEAYSLATTKDGSIFLGAYIRWNPTSEDWNASALVLKYSLTGVILWQWQYDMSESYGFYSAVNVMVSRQDQVFVEIPGINSIQELDLSNGNSIDSVYLANLTSYARHKIAPNGDFVSAEGGTLYQISWFNISTGTEEWAFIPSLIWQYLGPDIRNNGGFDVAPDNSVYVVCQLELNGNNTWVLTKIDDKGTMLWNRSLDIDAVFIRGIEVANDGSIYISSSTSEFFTALDIYQIGTFTPYWTTISTTSPTSSTSPINTTYPDVSFVIPILIILGFVIATITILAVMKKGFRNTIDEHWIPDQINSSQLRVK